MRSLPRAKRAARRHRSIRGRGSAAEWGRGGEGGDSVKAWTRKETVKLLQWRRDQRAERKHTLRFWEDLVGLPSFRENREQMLITAAVLSLSVGTQSPHVPNAPKYETQQPQPCGRSGVRLQRMTSNAPRSTPAFYAAPPGTPSVLARFPLTRGHRVKDMRGRFRPETEDPGWLKTLEHNTGRALCDPVDPVSAQPRPDHHQDNGNTFQQEDLNLLINYR